MSQTGLWPAARMFAVLVFVAVLGTGCTSILKRPAMGQCLKADPVQWSERASASLKVAPFERRQMYGAGEAGKPRPFMPGAVPRDSVAVVSYPEPRRYAGAPTGFDRIGGRSFIYDNALYVLVRTFEGEEDAARKVLQTIAALQRPDGAWGFSFNIRGDGFYNVDYVRTGAVAWVVYAIARYTSRFGDRRFVPAMRRGAAWLLGRRDPKSGLFLGGQGRWPPGDAHFEPGHVADWASTEHNVDIWFTLRALAAADQRGTWRSLIRPDGFGDALTRHLWLPKEGRYARGLQRRGLDMKSALDASGTWTAIFELGRNRPQRAKQLIAWVDREHQTVQDGWRIWRPYRDPAHALWFVEGSVARAIALHRLGDVAGSRKMIQELTVLACEGGVPLLYSNRWVPDYPKAPAAGPTAWYVLAVEEVWNGHEPFLWPTNVFL